MDTDVLIVGGGLAGLSLAHHLQGANVSYHLVEARPRLGGRIATQTVEAQEQIGYFDTGPTWFWPGQPRMETLVRELGLKAFLQYADGDLSFENEQGQVTRGLGYASMAGSLRLQGGLAALVDAVHQHLETSHLSLDLRVTALQHSSAGIRATCINAQNQSQRIGCQAVVLAVPPRVVAQQIKFSPELPLDAIKAMQGIATWMAGQAKIIAVYDRPFWRTAGLSGDAMSCRGPLVEIHDASPAQDGPYGLFGFVGVPVNVRQDHTDELLQATHLQLVRLFGPEALNTLALICQDWACEPETATQLDAQPQYTHPVYGLPQVLSNLWQGQLMLGSTEMATQFGGYLEGALESSEKLAQTLIPQYAR